MIRKQKRNTKLCVSIFFTAILMIAAGGYATIHAQSPTEDHIRQYAIYKPYGLVYNAADECLYFNGQLVRFFVDKYHHFQGIRSYYCYDPEGTIDLYSLRDDTSERGELIGIKAYSQEDFDLRTLQFEAEKVTASDPKVLTFRLKKEDAPESLKLWIRESEATPFVLQSTEQNGRYYIFCRGPEEFGFQMATANGEAALKIYDMKGAPTAPGYILLSVPDYRKLEVNYNDHYLSIMR